MNLKFVRLDVNVFSYLLLKHKKNDYTDLDETWYESSLYTCSSYFFIFFLLKILLKKATSIAFHINPQAHLVKKIITKSPNPKM